MFLTESIGRPFFAFLFVHALDTCSTNIQCPSDPTCPGPRHFGRPTAQSPAHGMKRGRILRGHHWHITNHRHQMTNGVFIGQNTISVNDGSVQECQHFGLFFFFYIQQNGFTNILIRKNP